MGSSVGPLEAVSSESSGRRSPFPSTVAGYSLSIFVTIGDLLNLTDKKRTSPAVRLPGGPIWGLPPPLLKVTASNRERSSLRADSTGPRAIGTAREDSERNSIVQVETAKLEGRPARRVVARTDRQPTTLERAG